MNRIIVAGGGTAGHIEPALAVARRWQLAHPDSRITFLGTKAGLETSLVPASGFALTFIPKVSVPRRISLKFLTLPFTLVGAISQSMKTIKGADLVIGFGGYVSAPAYLAAALTRTPFVIHEANARPGLANRLGALFTRYTAVAHPVESGSLKKSLLTGLPLKENIAGAYESAHSNWRGARLAAKAALGFDEQAPLVFIFGGSQGSAAINEVIAHSRQALNDMGVNILHGVGARNDLPESNSGYRAVNYISDMATAYLAADLIIARSGAVTCAEVNTLGRYALFIPLPIGNGEQNLNAASLVSQGRAEILPQARFSAEWMNQNLRRLLAQSSAAPISGSTVDIEATTKIVALMDYALSGGK
jgi:UDP-N-acetylglucosamine--N-acetylmuramyl-(pentapeptide) pyrophosphoryl-undecaprenol N-acetylglucosamine transferase